MLPGASEDTIEAIERGIERAGMVTGILEQGKDAKGLLETVLAEFELEITEPTPVEYRCYCSRERVERALISLGPEELKNILAEQGSCHMTCQFCDAEYEFTARQLQQIIEGLEAEK